MPYTTSNPPDRIKGLPKHAQAIFIAAFNSAIEQYNGNEERANKVAWAAVKTKYKKVGDKWVAKSDMKYFSMAFSKIVKRDGVMHFELTATDTDWDSQEERLALELFGDFIERENIKKAEQGEQYIPPYLSQSHYHRSLGDVNEIWIQGNRFKNRGIFYDDKYGRALFKAILEERASGEEVENPIKTSIGFWPYVTRKEDGKTVFIKGEFDHVAATRVPINERTSFDEVIEKSMITKKDDASSIIGDDLAEELDIEERNRKEKSDLEEGMVIKSEEEESSLTLLQEEILKSLLEEEEADLETIEKAQWDYGKKQGLADSDYLWVEHGAGCEKKDGKTPQKCRHLPYKEGGTIDCGHLKAAIQAIGGARTGKPMNVPAGVLSKAKRLYASSCQKKGKGLMVEIEPAEVLPFAGATTIADAVSYMKGQEAVYELHDDLHLFGTVIDNILRSSDVEDKKAAIVKTVSELNTLLKEDVMSNKEEKSSVLGLLEGIKDSSAAEKGDEAKPTPKEDTSLDALFGALKSIVTSGELDRTGKIAGAYQCLKAMGATIDKVIAETTPRTESDVINEIVQRMEGAITEAIKPLAEKVAILEAKSFVVSATEPVRKGFVVAQNAQSQVKPVKKGSIEWNSMLMSGLDPETGKAIF